MPGAVPVRVGRLVGVPSVVRRLVPAVFVLVMLAAGAAAASPSATAAATSRAFPTRAWATVGRTSARSRACSPIMASPFRSTGSSGLRRGRRSGPSRPPAACRSTASSARRPGSSSSSRSRRAARGRRSRSLQRQLNEKRFAGLTVDGVYGTATRNAVIAFQKHMGMTANGLVGPVTWRTLLWHFDYPAFNATSLCDYSVGNGTANWGTGAAIGQLEAAAAAFAATGHGRVPVGDISLEHGGDIALHETHEVGLDVDIRPIRDARNQCTWGTNWRFASYDRAATRALIKTIRAEAARPRQADLLQRPGAHRRGPDALVQRPRRPPPRPLLRAVLPARDLPLRQRLAAHDPGQVPGGFRRRPRRPALRERVP